MFNEPLKYLEAKNFDFRILNLLRITIMRENQVGKIISLQSFERLALSVLK